MSPIKNSILSGGEPISRSGAPEKSFSRESESLSAASAEVDASPKYFAIFLVLLTGVALWWSAQTAAFSAEPTISGLVKALVITSLFTGIAAFLPWFVRGEIYGMLIMLISGIGAIAFMSASYSGWMFFGSVLLVIFWYMAFNKAHRAIHEQSTIRFFSTTSSYLKTFLTGFALFLALLYVGAYVKAGNISLPVYRVAVQASAPIFQGFIPDFHPDISIEHAIESGAIKSLEKVDEFQLFSESEQQAAISQIVHEGRLKIAEATKSPILQDDTVATYSHRLVNDYLNKLREGEFGFVLTLMMAVVLFLLVRAGLFFFRWLILVVAQIVYSLLRATQVITIENEQRRKEIIVLK